MNKCACQSKGMEPASTCSPARLVEPKQPSQPREWPGRQANQAGLHTDSPHRQCSAQAMAAQLSQAAQRVARQAGQPGRPAHRQPSQTRLCTSKASPAKPDMVWHMVYPNTKNHGNFGFSRKHPFITVFRRPLRGGVLFTAE